jgi:hypothetical protein
MKTTTHAGLFALLATTIQAVSLPLPLRTVHQFSLPTYLNSIFVRPNGDIYVTTVWPNASIYSISAPNTDHPIVSLIHTFDEINATTAIVETRPNVLAFLGGNQSSLGVGINGTFGVWELDLRPTLDGKGGKPSIQELVRIPNGGLLAGLRPLPDIPSTVLVSDSTAGVVWRVDTLTRKYDLGLADGAMVGPVWGATQFGINGVQIRKGYLYWSNSYLASIQRMAITADGYAAPGAKSELVAALRAVYLDTFCFSSDEDDDTIWAATDADNRLAAISPDGKVTFVAGEPDQMTLAGSVAPAFGTLPGDTKTLYVATSGGMVFPINGTVVEGGKIVAVDTTGWK